MRQLRTCDFCDADAVGTFAVVPPELEPSEREQRRVVLCGDCKTQLEELLEPLLARAGVDDAGETADTPETTRVADRDDRRSTSGGSDGAAATDDRGLDETDGGTVVADESTRKRTRTSSPNATGSDSESAVAAAAEGQAEAEPTSASRVEETTGTGTDPSSSDGTDETAGTGADTAEETTETASESPATDADDADSAAGSGLGGGITFERSGSAADGGAGSDADDDAGSTDRPPKGYSKVMRLLQNRQFPMDRSAVQSLAAGAYDLEAYEVSAIIDHAIERGKFVEKRGELQRPD